MKRVPLLLIGCPALLVSLMLVWLDPAPFSALSHQIHDALLRKLASPARSGSVVIVDIDDASLAHQGQWPWSRHVLRTLVDNLWRQGAAVVVFDMVFPEPDRTSPVTLESEWRREFGPGAAIAGLPENARDHDADFAAALGRGRSVMGCYLALGPSLGDSAPTEDPVYRGHYFETGQPQRELLPQGTAIVQSLPLLRSHAAGEASFNTLSDRDNVIRRTPLLVAYGPNRIYPALSLEALRQYRGGGTLRIRYDRDLGRGVAAISLGNTSLPTDANGCLALNFRATPFPRVSAWKILAGAQDTVTLSNRVILIGTSAAGLNDLKATPLATDFPGIEVHATALDNMLAGDALHEPRWMFHANLLAVLLAGLALIVLVASMRAWLAFFAAAGFIALALATSAWALAAHRLVASPLGVIACTVLVYTSMTVVKYWHEERARHRVRLMFGTMVSPDVLRLMEENPSSFSLAGRKAEVTVLFSDIANFTNLAEALDPDVLTRLINRYLTEMTRIIMARGGYVDKFYGDAIMAVWGAPYALPGHALQACLAAREQVEGLEALNRSLSAEFGCTLQIRIGLNTGVVTAGNMGSANRFQYTVMGDAVNVASRLEATNRYCGTRILIGDETWIQARNQKPIEARPIGWIPIRGKTKPVLVHELLSYPDLHSPAMATVVDLYAQALSAFRERQWARAGQLAQQVLSLRPADGPARLLQANALHSLNHPPADTSEPVLDVGLPLK